MRLYTYLRAMERAHAKYRIYRTNELGYQYARIRDGLIKRLERITLENLNLKARVEYYENHLESNEIDKWGMP